jgi:hypothetical protein
MITLTHNNNNSYEVKSISAAWNKIREIRDNTPVEDINETILKVDMGEAQVSDRLPLEILFRVNTKGKVEFKDLAKVITRAAKKEGAKTVVEDDTKEEDLANLSIQVAEELNED